MDSAPKNVSRTAERPNSTKIMLPSRVNRPVWTWHSDAPPCCFLPQWFESSRIHAAALIIGQLSDSPSHWSSAKSLDQWLKEQGVPGIQGQHWGRSHCHGPGSGFSLGALGFFLDGNRGTVPSSSRRVPPLLKCRFTPSHSSAVHLHAVVQHAVSRLAKQSFLHKNIPAPPDTVSDHKIRYNYSKNIQIVVGKLLNGAKTIQIGRASASKMLHFR